MASSGHTATIAYDLPWNNLIRQVMPRSVNLSSPCIDERCGTWDRVRSVDLGKCSIELPYGRPLIPSPLLSLMIGDGWFSLAKTLLDGLGEALEGSGQRGCSKGICGRVSFSARPDDSTWYVDGDENLCLQARTYVFTQALRGIGLMPISKKCRNRPAVLELCGSIGLSPDQQIEWTTNWFSFELEPGNYRDCSNHVIKGIRNSIRDELVDNPNKPNAVNGVTQALREQLGSKLSISHASILRDLPKAHFMHLFLKTTCHNPAPFPGNVSDTCAFKDLNLPTRCVSSDPSAQTGSCHIASPLTRTEKTPHGIELVVSEHAWNSGQADWIWNLRPTLNRYKVNLDNPLLHAIYYYQCITDNGPDRTNQKTNSRYSERFLRGPKRVTLGASR